MRNGTDRDWYSLSEKFDYSIKVVPAEEDYRNITGSSGNVEGGQLIFKALLEQLHARFARASRWSSWKMANKCENEGQLTSRADIESVFEPLQLPRPAQAQAQAASKPLERAH